MNVLPLPPVFKDDSVPVKVRNASSVRYIFTGVRRRYAFDPGQVLEVDPEDAPVLLSIMRRGGSCCGGGKGAEYHYFELVEDHV